MKLYKNISQYTTVIYGCGPDSGIPVLWDSCELIYHLIASLQSLMPAADTAEVDPDSQAERTFSIGFMDLNGKVLVQVMMLSFKAVDKASLST